MPTGTGPATNTAELDKVLDSFSVPKDGKPDEPSETPSKSEDKAIPNQEAAPEPQEAEHQNDQETDFNTRLEAEHIKWQKGKDKELSGYQTTIATLQKEKVEMQRKLDAREDDRDLKTMFDAEAETDEDVAKRNDAARRKFAARYREFKDNSANVETQNKENEVLAENLGNIERHQKAVAAAHMVIFGQKFDSEVETIIKQLEEAESPREFELMLKSIKRERGSKKQPFKPDAAHNAGSGGQGRLTRSDLGNYDPRNKTPSQLLKDADNIINKFTKSK